MQSQFLIYQKKIYETIVFQLQNSVCKIFDANNKYLGLGFLITFKNNNHDKYFFMTNNYLKDIKYSILLNEKSEKIIINHSLSINYKNMINFIDMNDCLDKINIKQFLELDNNCISKVMTSIDYFFNNETIYIPNSNEKGDINILYGFLKEISYNNLNPKDKYIKYYPILSLKSKKVIGLYYENNNNNKDNTNPNNNCIIFPINEINKEINRITKSIFYFLSDNIKFNKLNKQINIANKKMNTELVLKYIIINKDIIKIFGKQFVINNKNNCSLIINHIEQDLVEYLELNNIPKEIIKKKYLDNKDISKLEKIRKKIFTRFSDI